MKKAFAHTVALAAGALLASSAYAGTVQTGRPLGLGIRAGVFITTSSVARAIEENVWFGVGVDYQIGSLNLGSGPEGFMSSYGISLDYLGKGDFRSVPVLLNYIARKEQMYFSVGAGVAFVRFPSSATTLEDQTKFAYQLSVGYDFQRGQTPIFLEARYHGNSESRLSGFGFYVGVRL